MNFVALTLALVAVLLAFLLGRCIIVSNIRLGRCDKQKAEIKKLKHRLDTIADSSKYDRYYEIEEDELTDCYNVNLKVYVRVSSYAGEHIDTCCFCLIKQFPFDDDKEFALCMAEELLETLRRDEA